MCLINYIFFALNFFLIKKLLIFFKNIITTELLVKYIKTKNNSYNIFTRL